MSLVDYSLLLLIGIGVIAAIRYLHRQKKQGKCAGCSGCHTKDCARRKIKDIDKNEK